MPTPPSAPTMAVMATFPARADVVQRAVATLAPQVDQLVLVLNAHTDVPAWCAAIPNLRAIVPDQDRKDVAKFSMPFPDDTWVFLADDDILYPHDYVAQSLVRAQATGLAPRAIFGYHGTIYGFTFFHGLRASLRRHSKIFRRTRSLHPSLYRHVLVFGKALDRAWKVEQLGTGTVMAMGKNLMALQDAEGSEMRVDTRLAAWAHRQGIPMIALPRQEGWMVDTEQDNAIYTSYTLHTTQAFKDEVARFAGKIKKTGPL